MNHEREINKDYLKAELWPLINHNTDMKSARVGLGVVGRSLALNMAGHGLPAAEYAKDLTKVEALRTEFTKRYIRGAVNVRDFIAVLRKPHAVIRFLPSGAAADSVIKGLVPYLDKGNLVRCKKEGKTLCSI